MGSGTNCSYTNSTSGVYVHLLCSSPACCDTTSHACTLAACSSGSSGSSADSVTTYLFWVILAGAAVFTVLVLFVSYAICRYRKPGCADAGAARDRFLEENVLPATLSGWPGSTTTTTGAHPHSHSSSSPSSNSISASNSQASTSTPSLSSPPAGQSPSASPDPLLLVHRPLNKAKGAAAGRSMIPVKSQPSAAAVNKAFIMGAEAFARKPITVRRSQEPQTTSSSSSTSSSRREAGPPVVVPAAVQRVQNRSDVSTSGAASPRMVQLGGLTPRINLRSKGRTGSKQAIISADDTDSLTTVGT